MGAVAKEFHRGLEEAANAAWPAAEETLYDGWLLRSSEGYTKRANSANPVYPGTLEPEEKIRYVENYYQIRQLPSTFRLTPFAPPDLDFLLAKRRYLPLDPTLVLARPVEIVPFKVPKTIALVNLPRNQWLATFTEYSSAPPESHDKHDSILQRIKTPAYYGVLKHEGHTVACGLAVARGRFVGLFDLITAPGKRRKGYGTFMVHGLISWARSQGADHVYLQVMESNSPARSLYKHLGFKQQYRYWYRRQRT